MNKRFVKKQQMQWTPRGAYLLLRFHTKTLNDNRGLRPDLLADSRLLVHFAPD